jgi:hypothetical protein
MTKTRKTVSSSTAYQRGFRAGQRSRERLVDDMRLAIRRYQDDLYAAHTVLMNAGLEIPKQRADPRAVEAGARESLLRAIERRGRAARGGKR